MADEPLGDDFVTEMRRLNQWYREAVKNAKTQSEIDSINYKYLQGFSKIPVRAKVEPSLEQAGGFKEVPLTEGSNEVDVQVVDKPGNRNVVSADSYVKEYNRNKVVKSNDMKEVKKKCGKSKKAKMHSCVDQVQDQGKSEDSAWAICTESIEKAWIEYKKGKK